MDNFFLILFLFSLLAIILGLIKPSLVIKWGSPEKRTRWKVLLFYSLTSLVFFILVGITAPELTPEQKAVLAAEKKEKEADKAAKQEAKAKKESEEKAKKDLENKLKEEEKAKEEAEKLAKQEAKAKKESEEKAKKDLEKNLKAEEKAKQEAEAKKLAEEAAKQEAQAKKEAEEKAAREAIEKQQAFIKSAVQINYIDLARNPDSYKSKKIYFKGKVEQTMEDGRNVVLLLAVTEDREFGLWDDTIWVTYTLPKGNGRILENDIINLWGTVDGLKTYESVLGQEITIPKLKGEYIEILGHDS